MKKSCLLIYLLAVIAIASCQKDEISDPLAFEVVKSLGAYNKLPSADGGLVISDGKVLHEGGRPAAFFAQAGRLSTTAVAVTASVSANAALLQIYDSLYHTKSPLFAEGAFATVNGGKCIIPTGKYTSPDSICILPSSLPAMAVGSYRYVVPVTLTSIPADVLKSKIMFVKYNVTVANAWVESFSAGRNNLVQTVYNNFPQTLTPLMKVTLDRPLGYEAKFAMEGISTQALVDAYNAKFSTDYKPFPTGSYSFSRDSVTIPGTATAPALAAGSVYRPVPAMFPAGSTYVMAICVRNKRNEPMTPEEILNSKNVVYSIITAKASM
ncbi:DUF1735 domain-containing protein [Chitinophaga horti]|uniref:DUF1735 domain-containing protein n=1 Tax=Chitinophaga horti TaxID=2920382 RepID=A0ABY6J2T4_9BACT|nr:DUF1735 domain-containing protein [Chitinophaga horti]UYQ93820.1 DUF1735 domain-containing protein [Chitinophaga horti]